MEKGAVKLIVFNGEDFSYWKNPDLQLSLEPRSHHLGDFTGSIHHPSNAWECNPVGVVKVREQLQSLESHYYWSR
jgi:hypothetical protein